MNQKNNLVKNASFLMVAAMISKVIGLLYKSPLSSIVGNMGMGYISLAQNAYMILLMIASFSIPQAVSKLISERIALKDYKNAQNDGNGFYIPVKQPYTKKCGSQRKQSRENLVKDGLQSGLCS